jgi:hypothetical protein
MEAEDVFRRYCERNTVSLFKGFLVMLEDLGKEHEIHFRKLKRGVPTEYLSLINQADYLDEEKLQHLRKRVLDMGNEAIRSFDGGLDNFTISFEFN